MESQLIPHWSWSTCTKWQAEKRLTCLPAPAELNAELSTVSPHFLFVFVAGDIRDLLHAYTLDSVAVLIQNIILIQTMGLIPTEVNDEFVCRVLS